MVTLSRAVAVAMVHGPVAGLALLGTLDADEPDGAHPPPRSRPRPPARTSRSDRNAAREAYLRAARMTASLPEQRYLTLRAASLSATGLAGGSEADLGWQTDHRL